MISKNLMAASTKPMILSILSKGEFYGYEIIQKIIDLSGGVLEWSEGMLYPVLHRMERDLLIRSQWKISENGRRRKYYGLMERGRQELEEDRKQWLSVHKVFSELWDASAAFD
jgi:PadR family transcriptional regulator PadR